MFPRPHQLGGQSGRASRPLERCHRTWQRRRHHRPTVLLPLLRQWRGALASVGGFDGEICGERGASTHPFDPVTVCLLEVHFYNGSWLQHGRSSDSTGSSSNDTTSDHDSWWDTTCVGALLRPFDPGKRCRRSTRRGKAALGVDLPFDCGKAWGRLQHGG